MGSDQGPSGDPLYSYVPVTPLTPGPVMPAQAGIQAVPPQRCASDPGLRRLAVEYYASAATLVGPAAAGTGLRIR